MFHDVTSLVADPQGLRMCVDDFVAHYQDIPFDVVVGIDSRGFIFGPVLAYLLGKGFVPIRKKGKLPAATIAEEYALEYGLDTLEIHEDAVEKGQRVLIVDDLIATGGTAVASINLIRKLGGKVIGYAAVVNLPDIGGRQKIEALGIPTYCQAEFTGN